MSEHGHAFYDDVPSLSTNAGVLDITLMSAKSEFRVPSGLLSREVQPIASLSNLFPCKLRLRLFNLSFDRLIQYSSERVSSLSPLRSGETVLDECTWNYIDSSENKYCSITCLLFEYLDTILDNCVIVTPARISCFVMDCWRSRGVPHLEMTSNMFSLCVYGAH